MISDQHVHTSFSTDSDTPAELQIEKAISLGMDAVCITDHMDMDFPGGTFCLDTPSYVEKILTLKETYRKQIEVRLGVELGLQLHLAERISSYINEWPFDFAIGSMHLLHGEDPYTGRLFREFGDKKVYEDYFCAILENLKICKGIHTLGHLDYVVRYGLYKEQEYSYRTFSDIIDEILKLLIEKGIGLELNTAGLKYGLGFPHPHPDVWKRYRELGGEIVTVGSDGHIPLHVGYSFEEAADLLKSCGFRYYAEFREKKPLFTKIP